VQQAQISQHVLLEPPALSHPSCAAVPQPSTESHIQQSDAHAQRTGEAMCMKQLERGHSLAVHAQSLGGVGAVHKYPTVVSLTTALRSTRKLT
jgi:hypothetical protein